MASCKSENMLDCINSSGPVIEERRQIIDFHKLTIDSDIDLYWHYDSSENYVIVRCGRNLQKNIQTEAKDGEFKISNENRCNWVRSYKKEMRVDLFSKAPDFVSIKGFGNVVFEDTLFVNPLTIQHYGPSNTKIKVVADQLYIDFNSVGELNVEGKAKFGLYQILNFGKLDASNVEMDNLEIAMLGSNDIKIKANVLLTGYHDSPRTVFLVGNPLDKLKIKSSGKVERVWN
jgi:hypothetical protein